MNTILKFAAVAVIGAFAFSAPALAVSTGNLACTINSGPTERGNLLTSTPASISCPMFDSNLGVPLNSMVLNIAGSISGSITLTNNALTAQFVEATTNSAFKVVGLTGFGFTAFPGNLFTASMGTGPQVLGAGVLTAFGPLAGAASSGEMASSNLGAYTLAGGGSFPIDFYTLTGITIDGGGGQIGSSQVTNASFTGYVRYDYGVFTPEPASMAILGMGMLALGMVRRRR